jgi:Poly(ADP-ribose) polymerase and DNA-Ligase Zn-finger region
MAHTFEAAASGRSKCRGCGQALPKGELRFGERLPNPFGEGEVTHWFHPACAAYKRPDAVIEALAAAASDVDRATIERLAQASLAHERLARIDGAERSPSSQARCRHCHEPIEKGGWRIRLVFHTEGTFAPGGFIHLACREPYFGTADIVEQVLHFSAALSEPERAALREGFAA